MVSSMSGGVESLMKVGDIVRQTDTIVKMKGRHPSRAFGVVIEINDVRFPPKMRDWEKFIGRGVTVLWASGKITENFAENSLEVVNESR